MYRIINKLAFIACLLWLYLEPSPEPVVVLLLSTAGFFRDDIHGVIGKNIFTLTPKNSLIRDFSISKFSFIKPDWINPRIIEDLVGWLSDTGDQIVSINLTESNKSNRYHGKILSKEFDVGFPMVTAQYNESSFSYRYLGCSFSGVHLIQTWSCGGGSGVFCRVVLVTFSQDSALEYEKGNIDKVNRFVIKLIGSIPLGDRYQGEIKYKYGFLSIPACCGMQTLRKLKSTLLVL